MLITMLVLLMIPWTIVLGGLGAIGLGRYVLVLAMAVMAAHLMALIAGTARRTTPRIAPRMYAH
jgi:hypothetical protein